MPLLFFVLAVLIAMSGHFGWAFAFALLAVITAA